ncbi:MAG: glycosyltransferase family 9 protein [Acidiferrobacteraceae bacterium]
MGQPDRQPPLIGPLVRSLLNPSDKLLHCEPGTQRGRLAHRNTPTYRVSLLYVCCQSGMKRAMPDAGISLARKTAVATLAALLAQCDLIVSLDTGTFHVARAVGLPSVVIAPAWQSPLEWLPVASERYRVLRRPASPKGQPPIIGLRKSAWSRC